MASHRSNGTVWCGFLYILALTSATACAVPPPNGAATSPIATTGPIAVDTTMRFVSMDSAEYRFSATSRRLKLVVVFRNASRDTLFLHWCGGEIDVAIERLTNDGWKKVYWRDCPLVLRDAVVVAPGQTYRFPITIVPHDRAPRELWVGDFRILVSAYPAKGPADIGEPSARLPVASRTSPPFVIRQ